MPVDDEEFERRVDELEEQAEAAASGDLSAASLGLMAALTVLWSVYGDDLDDFRVRLSRLLEELPEPSEPEPLLPVLTAATLFGASQVEVPVGVHLRPAEPSRSAVREVLGAPWRARNRMEQARFMGRIARDFDDVVRIAALIRRAAQSLPVSARWAVTRAVADAMTAICDQLGWGRQWVTEPDPCPTCADLDGSVAAPGQPFFGVDSPPAHPSCRCRLRAVPLRP